MTNANSKDESKFSGKQGKGLTFEEFDKKSLSWARKKYGNMYAKQLWENQLQGIKNLDLTEDLDYCIFHEHCEYVYDMLCLDSVKNADTYIIPHHKVLDREVATGESSKTVRKAFLLPGNNLRR